MAIINQDWISEAVTTQPIGFWADIDSTCYIGGLVEHVSNIGVDKWTVASTSAVYITGVLLAINSEGKGFIATRGVVELTCDAATDVSNIFSNEMVQIHPSSTEVGKVNITYNNGTLTDSDILVSHILLAGDKKTREIKICL